MKKRVFSLFLALAMVLTFLPINGFAVASTCFTEAKIYSDDSGGFFIRLKIGPGSRPGSRIAFIISQDANVVDGVSSNGWAWDTSDLAQIGWNQYYGTGGIVAGPDNPVVGEYFDVPVTLDVDPSSEYCLLVDDDLNPVNSGNLVVFVWGGTDTFGATDPYSEATTITDGKAPTLGPSKTQLTEPSVSGGDAPATEGVGTVTIAPGNATDVAGIDHYVYTEDGNASNTGNITITDATAGTATWTPTTAGRYTFRAIAKSGSDYTDSADCAAYPVNATYEVTFSANGGSGTQAAAYATTTGGSATVSYQLPTCGFTAPDGQKFNGWKVDGIAGNQAAGATVSISSSVTATAQWAALTRNLTITAGNITATYPTPGTSTVTVKNNGDALTNAILKVKSVDGSTSDLKGISVTGWTAGAMANGASKSATLTTSASTPAKSSYSVVLAVLDGTTEVKTQTVTVTVNKAKLATPTATGGSAPATEGVGSVTLSTSDANHGKYQVSKSSSGPWTDYTGGTALSEAGSYYFRSVPTDTTNYAESNATSAVAVNATYKVTFNANGGSGSQAAAYASTTGGSKSVSYTPPTTTTMTAPSGKPVFKGWATSASGSVQSSVSLSASTTLYAIWEGATTGGATVNVPAKSVVYNGTSTEAYSGATKSGGSWTVDNTKTKIEYYVGSAWTTTAPTNVGTYNVRVTMGDSTGAYEAQGTGTGAYKVTARPITIEKSGGETKVYGAAAIALSANNYALASGSTMGAGDSWTTLRSSVTLSSTGNVDTRLSSIGDYAITAACSNSNYTVTVSSKLNVTAKELTANAVTVTKVYDGTNTIKQTSGTVAGAVSGDTVTLSLGGTYNDANAGTGKTLSITTWQLAGADRAKYTLNATTNKPTTGTITAQSTTISMSNPSAAYVGVDSTLPAIKVMAGGTDVTDQFDLTVTASRGTVTKSGSNYILNVPAPNGSITLTVKASPKSGVVNYAAPTDINKTVTVNNATASKLNATTTATTVQYGNTFDITITKDANGGAVSVEDSADGKYQVVSSNDSKATIKVLTYTGSVSVKVKQAGAGTTGAGEKTVTVTAAKRSLTWGTNTLAATNRPYNGQTSIALTGTLTISGVLTEDTGKVTLGTVPTSGSVATEDAGNAKAVTYTAPGLSGDKAAYYQLSAAPSLTVNITKVPVTVSGTVTKTYDGNTNKGSATGTLSVSGAVNSETVTVSSFAGTFDKANATGSNAASKFTISVSGTTLSSSNYELTAAQEVTGVITKATPPTPTLTSRGISNPGMTDGSITISNYSATYTYEYQKSGDSSWTAATGATISSLGAGTYSVRVRENENYTAGSSANATVSDVAKTHTIGAAGAVAFGSLVFGSSQPPAKTVEFTNSGNAAQRINFALTGTDAGKFTLSATSENVAAGGKTTITVRPNADLDVGTYTAQVKATCESGDHNVNSGNITFTVTKATQAAVSGTATAKTDTTVTIAPSGGTAGTYYVNYVRRGQSAPAAGATGWVACTGTDPKQITGLSANTDYDFYVKRDDGKNYNPVISSAIPVTTEKTALTGTLSISGTTKVGQTLTANKTSVNDSSAVVHWYANTSNSNSGGTELGTGNSYQLKLADLGKYIYAKLAPSANYSGDVTSAAVGPVKVDPVVNADSSRDVKYATTENINVTLGYGSDDLSSAYHTALGSGSVTVAKSDTNGILSGDPTLTWSSNKWVLSVTAAGRDESKVGKTATITLTFPATGDYNAPAAKTITIKYADREGLTVNATAKQSVDYNGSAKTFTINSITAGGNTVGTSNYDVTYYDATGTAVTSPKDAGVYNIVITPKGAYADYAAMGSTTNSDYQLTINKIDLTAKLQALKFQKTYDKSTNADIDCVTSSKTISTGVNSESLTLTAVTGAFDNVNAASGKTVTISSVTLSGDAAKNYKIGTKDITAGTAVTGLDVASAGNRIDPKAVHVDATKTDAVVAGFNRVYNGSGNQTTAALTADATLAGYLTASEIESGDTVALAITSGKTGTFADGSAGENKTVTVTAANLKLVNNADGNYKLENSASVQVKATISRKQLTLATTPVSVVKDDKVNLGSLTSANAQASATAPSGKNIFVHGIVGSDSVAVTYTFKDLNANGTGMAGLDPSNGEVTTNPTTTGSATATVTAAITNGNYTFAADGTEKNNTDATVTINVRDGNENTVQIKQGSTAWHGTSQTKTYGDAAVTLTGSALHGTSEITWSSSNPDVVSVSGTGANCTLTFLKGGTATITASAPAGGGYATGEATVSVTVNKKAIQLNLTGSTLTSNHVYDGQTDVTTALGGTLAFKAETGGAAVTLDPGDYSGTLSASVPDKNVGTKTVTLSGITLTSAGAEKYELKESTLTGYKIGAKPITINTAKDDGVVSEYNREYKGTSSRTADALTAQKVLNDYLNAADIVAGDDVQLAIKTGSTGTFETGAAENNKKVTIASSRVELAGTDKDNYSLTAAGITVRADIKPKQLTLTTNAINVVKDGAVDLGSKAAPNAVQTSASGKDIFVSGLVSGDTVAVTYRYTLGNDGGTGLGMLDSGTGVAGTNPSALGTATVQVTASVTDPNYTFASDGSSQMDASANMSVVVQDGSTNTVTIKQSGTAITTIGEKYYGDSAITLTATATYTGSGITWESSDPTVATVESGRVTFLKAGNATITAKAPAGGGYGPGSASVDVTVKPMPLKMDLTNATKTGHVYDGQSEVAANLGNYTLIFKDKNNRTVTLNDGADYSGALTATLDNPNVGTKELTLGGITLDAQYDGKYELVESKVSGYVITAKEITLTEDMLTGLTATKKAGEGSTSSVPLAMPDATITDPDTGETLTLRLADGATTRFANDNPATDKEYTVNTSKFVLADGSGLGSNYKLVGSAITMHNGVVTQDDSFGLSLSPRSVNIQETAGYEQDNETQTVTLKNTGNKDGQVISLRLEGEHAYQFAVKADGGEISSVTLDKVNGGNDSKPLTIALRTGAAPGTYTAELVAELTGGDGQTYSDKTTITAVVESKGGPTLENAYNYKVDLEVGDTDGSAAQQAKEADYFGTLSYEVTSGQDVIEVDPATGAITVLKPGNATITVTAPAYGDYQSTTKPIKVKVNAQTLELDQPTITKEYDGNDRLVDNGSGEECIIADTNVPGVTVEVRGRYGSAMGEKASDVESNKPITITSWTLKGDDAASYRLPDDKPTDWTGTITKATPKFYISEDGRSINLSQAKRGATPMVSIHEGTPVSLTTYGLNAQPGDPAADTVQLYYYVPAMIDKDQLSNCGCADRLAHTSECELVKGEMEDPYCTCGAGDDIAKSMVHGSSCALNNGGAHCDCKIRDGLTAEQHQPGCLTSPGWESCTSDAAKNYLSSLKVGDTVRVKVYMQEEGSNLRAVQEANATEGSFTVSPDPTPSVTPSEPDEVHEPYLIGFPDGTFQPQGYLNRAEAATIMSRLTEGYDPEAVYAQHYPDVWDGSWFASSIGFATDHDLITGFPDGTFLARQSITRAEFTVLVARFAGVEPLTDFDINDYMTDSNNRWFEPYIAAMIEKGFAEGYEDGSYKPLDPIKRSEAVRMMNQVLDRKPDEGKVDQMNLEDMYPDVTKSNWFYYDVMEASLEHKESEYHKLSERMVD